MLIEVEAVRFSAKVPFKFTSGWASPVYIDCRKLISYPRVRHTLMDFAASEITRNIGFESIDSIAGGETAGIPFAAWIADRMMLPMQYVRKKAKGFGRNAQIEGDFENNSHILLVEDLTTDGNSKIKFCEALREAGAKVDHTFVVFYYDIFPQTRETLDKIWFNEKPFQGIIIDQPSTHLNFKILSSEGNEDNISSIEISKGFSTSPSILIFQGFVLKF